MHKIEVKQVQYEYSHSNKKIKHEILYIQGYDGVMFIGDPHLWSKKPGTRLDLSFAETGLKKMTHAVEIANEKNLFAFCLGDLFHVDYENDIKLLTGLTRILKKLPLPMYTIEGNHEKKELHFTDDVAVSLLRESGTLLTMEENRFHCVVSFQVGEEIHELFVGSTPYGQIIPQHVERPQAIGKNVTKVHVAWLTHHDLDFGETYPGVIPIKEIQGVDFLVNGHIHKTKKPVRVGQMIAYNPGNIMRMSTDCQDHIPSVWQWKPEHHDSLEPFVINHERDVFSMVGKNIKIDKQNEIVPETVNTQVQLEFVKKLESVLLEDDMDKTDDGEKIKKSISSLGKAMSLQSDFIDEILQITNEAIEKINKE